MTRAMSFVLLFVLAFSLSAVAQDQMKPLTVQECVRLALEGNRVARAAREQAESARQSLKETGAQRLPRVSTSASYARIEDSASTGLTGGSAGGTSSGLAGDGAGSFGGIETYTSAGARITQPLTDQIRLSHSVGIARLEAAIAALDQASAENQAAFRARNGYYAVLRLEKTAESVEQTITEFESTLKLTRSLKDAGRVLQRDVNKADIAVEQAKLELLRARNGLQSARSSLRDVLGLALDAPMALRPTEQIEAFDLELEACVSTAFVERPGLRASLLRSQAARRGVRLAKSAYIPSVGASVSYAIEDTDLTESEDTVTFGLQWSWDLWDWGRRGAAVRGAQAGERAARLAYENARNQVALEVERLWLSVEVARKNIDVARKDWDYAVENVRVSREQYEAGTLLITDLLDDQTALNDARIAYYVAIYDHAIELADLHRALGRR